MRAQLPDRDTVFNEWNDDMLCNDEFLTKIYLPVQPRFEVERNERGSLT
jgi:hypothetical protein